MDEIEEKKDKGLDGTRDTLFVSLYFAIYD